MGKKYYLTNTIFSVEQLTIKDGIYYFNVKQDRTLANSEVIREMTSTEIKKVRNIISKFSKEERKAEKIQKKIELLRKRYFDYVEGLKPKEKRHEK